MNDKIRKMLEMTDTDIPVFGMVKDGKHRTRAIASDGGEISIASAKPAFDLCTRIQDEVHRFAITYQRSKHRKNSFALSITSVNGIGEKKAMKLLTHFKTIENMRRATPEEIAAAAGVSKKVAEDVAEFVKNAL